MNKYKTSRRRFVKTSLASAAGGALGIWTGQPSLADEAEKFQLNITGYDYDRVRAIMDRQVGIDGAEINFDVKDIYSVSRSAFGPAQKYAITELGLLPYVRKYINEGFRAYTPIPVFYFAYVQAS